MPTSSAPDPARPMVLRILRATVGPAALPALQASLHGSAIPEALAAPGLLSVQPAVRRVGAGLQAVLVSTWGSIDDLHASGPDLAVPLALPRAGSLLPGGHPEHYELVFGASRLLPLRGRRLRISDVPLQPRMEAAYFAQARTMVDRLLEAPGLVGFHLARRFAGGANHAVAVSVWDDQAAIDRLTRQRSDLLVGGAATSAHLAGEPEVEHFDALVATEPPSDGPAVLVGDGEGRCLFANPAAEILVGRPYPSLVTLRLADLLAPDGGVAPEDPWHAAPAGGRLDAPLLFSRPDGTRLELSVRVAANRPWPGAQAWILTPPADRAPVDIEVALGLAGLTSAGLTPDGMRSWVAPAAITR